MSSTDALGEEYRTRPGTPMIGVYSVNQMDDFYTALAAGEVKPTGIMNYLQRLLITERCRPGDRVLDVCCGRGLQLPVLYRYRPDLATYVGLDISAENLAEATARQATLDAAHPRGFSIEFHQCDVAASWPEVGLFDVVVYTSALEHLPRELGVASLRHTAAALDTAGRLYLSTPNTPGEWPRKLQHRVHVYEWSHRELTTVLDELTDAEGGQVAAQVISALSTGGSFLRTGHPLTETFALMALKVREYELVTRMATPPPIVLEDRGMDTVALYQAAILLGPDATDEDTWSLAQQIYATAAMWRPPPELTLLVIDDITHCLRRYAEREGAPLTDEEQYLVTRVARLYPRLAEHEPDRIRIVHRADRSEHDIVAEMEHLVLTGTGAR